MPSALFRAREALADRFPRFQYPRQQFIPRERPPLFKYPITWELRGALALYALIAFTVALLGAAIAVLVFWAIAASLFA